MTQFLLGFGALRLLLFLCVLFLIAISPWTGGHADFQSAGTVVKTVVAPAFYVMVVFVLPLDMMMTRVFMSGKSGADRKRLVRIFWVEVVLFVALLLSWLPFVLKLVRLA